MEALNDLRAVARDLLGEVCCGSRMRIYCDDYASCDKCRAMTIKTAAGELEAALGAKAETICAQNREIDTLKDRAAMPDGIEWPRFEDGELVNFGDLVRHHDGSSSEVNFLRFDEVGVCISDDVYVPDVVLLYGESVKRGKPKDAQEIIDSDAKKEHWLYWGCADSECCDCHALVDSKKPYQRYRTDSCKQAMTLDLLRRQRELCEREKVGEK